MSTAQNGPYPVLFAKNITRARINLQTTVGGTGFRRSLGPGETKEVPWVIAKSAGFHRLWLDGKLEVSDRFDFSTTLDELPSIGADGGPTNWDDIEGVPGEFPPAEHTRSWDDIAGRPDVFPPADHDHAIADVDGLQTALNGKAPSTHTHTTDQVDGLDAALADKVDDSDARLSDARTPTSHTHTWGQVNDKPTTFPPETHTHAWADITDPPTIPPAAPVAEAQADSGADNVADLVADFNELLGKLRAAGIIES